MPKLEQILERNYHYHALSAVESYIQRMRSTWDILSPSVKVAMYTTMAQLIEDAIVQLEENSELNK